LRSQQKSLAMAIIVASSLMAIMSTAFITVAQSGIEVSLKVYTTNVFGWETTHVITTARAVLATSTSFDTNLSYTTREAWAAWWCLTCFASAKEKYKTVDKYVIGEDTAWTQGSWNVKYDGENHVWLYIYGPYYVREKVYYDVNGVTITVVDAIKSAIDFVVDNISKLLPGSK